MTNELTRFLWTDEAKQAVKNTDINELYVLLSKSSDGKEVAGELTQYLYDECGIDVIDNLTDPGISIFDTNYPVEAISKNLLVDNSEFNCYSRLSTPGYQFGKIIFRSADTFWISEANIDELIIETTTKNHNSCSFNKCKVGKLLIKKDCTSISYCPLTDTVIDVFEYEGTVEDWFNTVEIAERSLTGTKIKNNVIQCSDGTIEFESTNSDIAHYIRSNHAKDLHSLGKIEQLYKDAQVYDHSTVTREYIKAFGADPTPLYNGTRLPDSFVEYTNVDKDVVLNDNIEIIGKRAFIGTAIESVTLPRKLKYISENAFANCSLLGDVYYKGTMEEWAKNVDLSQKAFRNSLGRGKTVHCLDGDSPIYVVKDKPVKKLTDYDKFRKEIYNAVKNEIGPANFSNSYKQSNTYKWYGDKSARIEQVLRDMEVDPHLVWVDDSYSYGRFGMGASTILHFKKW